MRFEFLYVILDIYISKKNFASYDHKFTKVFMKIPITLFRF